MADFKVIPAWHESVNRDPQAHNLGLGGEKVSDYANLLDGFTDYRQKSANYNETVRRTNANYDPAKLREEQYQLELENQRKQFDLEFDEKNKQIITDANVDSVRASTYGQILQNEFYPAKARASIASSYASAANSQSAMEEREALRPFKVYEAEQSALGAELDNLGKSPEGIEYKAQVAAKYRAPGKAGKYTNQPIPLPGDVNYQQPVVITPQQRAEEANNLATSEQETSQFEQQAKAARERVAGLRTVQAINAPYTGISREDDTPENFIRRLGVTSHIVDAHPDPVVKQQASSVVAQQLQEAGSRSSIEDRISQLPPEQQAVAKEQLNEAVVNAGATTHYSELQKNLSSYGLPDKYIKKPDKALDAVNDLIDKGSIEADEELKKNFTDSEYIIGARIVSKSADGSKQPYTINTEMVPGQPQIDPITNQPGAPGPSEKKVVFRGQDGKEYHAPVLDPQDPAYTARWIVEAAAKRHNEGLPTSNNVGATVQDIQAKTDALAQAEAENQQSQIAAPVQTTNVPTVESVTPDSEEGFKKRLEVIKQFPNMPELTGATATEIAQKQRESYIDSLNKITDPELREQVRMNNPLNPNEKYSPVVKADIAISGSIPLADDKLIKERRGSKKDALASYFSEGKIPAAIDPRLNMLRKAVGMIEKDPELEGWLGPEGAAKRTFKNLKAKMTGNSDIEIRHVLETLDAVAALGVQDFIQTVGGIGASNSEFELENNKAIGGSSNNTLEGLRNILLLGELKFHRGQLLAKGINLSANSDPGDGSIIGPTTQAIEDAVSLTPTYIQDLQTGKVVKNPEAPQTLEEILFPQSKKKDNTQAVAPSTIAPTEETPPPTTGGNTPPDSDAPSVEPVSDDYRAKVDKIKEGLRARVSKDGSLIEKTAKNIPENMAQLGIGMARKIGEGLTNVVPALMSLGVDKTTEEVKEDIKTSIGSYLEENYPNMKKLYDWELETVANSAIGRHVQAVKENNDEYLAENPMTNIAAEIAAFLVPSTAVTKGVDVVSKTSKVANVVKKAKKSLDALGTTGKLIKGVAGIGAGTTADVAITKTMHPESDNTTTALVSGVARTAIPAVGALYSWFNGPAGSQLGRAMSERVDPKIMDEFLQTQDAAVNAKDINTFMQNIDVQKYPQFKEIKAVIQEQIGTDAGRKAIGVKYSEMQKAFQAAREEALQASGGLGTAMENAATQPERAFTSTAIQESTVSLNQSIDDIVRYASEGKTTELNSAIDDVSSNIGKTIKAYSDSAAKSVGSNKVVKRIAALTRNARKAVGVDKIPFIKQSAEEVSKLQKNLYKTFEESYPTVPEGTSKSILQYLKDNHIPEGNIQAIANEAASREAFKRGTPLASSTESSAASDVYQRALAFYKKSLKPTTIEGKARILAQANKDLLQKEIAAKARKGEQALGLRTKLAKAEKELAKFSEPKMDSVSKEPLVSDTSGYILELVDIVGRETGKNNPPARNAIFKLAAKTLAEANPGKKSKDIVSFFDNYGIGSELSESLAKQGTKLQTIVDTVSEGKLARSSVTGEAAEKSRELFGTFSQKTLDSKLLNVDRDTSALKDATLEGTGIGGIPLKAKTVADEGFEKALDPRQLQGFKEILNTKADENVASSLAKLSEADFQSAHKNIVGATGKESKLVTNLQESAWKNLLGKMQKGVDYAAENTDRVVRSSSIEEFLSGVPGQKIGANEYNNLLEMSGPGSKEYLEALFSMAKKDSREMEQFFTKGVTDLPSLLGNNATIGFRRTLETPWYGTDIGLKAAGAFHNKLSNKKIVSALTSKDPKVVEQAFREAASFLKKEVPGISDEVITQASVFMRGFLIGTEDSNRKARAARNRAISKNKKK